MTFRPGRHGSAFTYIQSFMKLFKYDAYKVVISEEAFALKPFRDVWQADKSKDKSRALLELGYVYFMCDPRSDYMIIADEGARSESVIKEEGLPDGWEPSSAVKRAMEFYRGFKPASALLLEGVSAAIDKQMEYLKTFDLDKTDASGKPVYTLSTLTTALDKLLSLIPKMREIERAMNTDMAEAGRMRGGGEKTVFEDDLDA